MTGYPGKQGRRPKPSALKILEGNPGKRALNRDEPKPRPIAPPCPRWMTNVAKREWRRVSPILERLTLLTEADGAALAGYCQSYARWRECEAIVRREGPSYETHTAQGERIVRAHPAVRSGQAYLAQVRFVCAEFGLTPSSSGRLSIPEPPEYDDILD